MSPEKRDQEYHRCVGISPYLKQKDEDAEEGFVEDQR